MKKIVIVITSFFLYKGLFAQVYATDNPLAHTFSIVARDPATGQMAVAVQSHWFSVGTTVSWAEAGVGAVATQSFVNKSFGIRGLNLLRAGLTAQQALDSLLSDDAGREVRQVAIVDTFGHVATFTGKGCIQYACHLKGDQFSVQANMMLGDQVCASMYKAYNKNGDKPFADRIISALEAGQTAGGDIRGRQSAAIIVVPARSAGRPWEERWVDLRVDDNQQPIRELRRLYNVHLAYEHMNKGDLAVEKNDMQDAMREYDAAMKMFPDNLEMQYWTAITLANNKEFEKAIPMFKKIFKANSNWKELTKRLPSVHLLDISGEELNKILAL
ncbi:MAG: DUF1028 domain-containing protein [Terrimonas sp.]|nr:DUF1028 domain-containing protein [Terrimonas sp.]